MRLFVWEEEVVEECCTLIHNIVLQVVEVDRWQWMLDPSNGYLVSGVYRMLITMDPSISSVVSSIT